MSIENILSLVGGLGLFLYGMTVMSDSIEKAAGAKMRGSWLSLPRTDLSECCLECCFVLLYSLRAPLRLW